MREVGEVGGLCVGVASRFEALVAHRARRVGSVELEGVDEIAENVREHGDVEVGLQRKERGESCGAARVRRPV